MAQSKAGATAIVLAAGHGKRLMPLTRWLPKPLVPINGTPILETNLRNLAASGFPRAVVVYGRPTAAIPDFLAASEPLPLEVLCALQKEQHGTGDALLTGINAAPAGETYLLLVGDAVYTPEHLDAVWNRFAAGDVDGCLLVKQLPPRKLSGSSLVSLREDGTIEALLAKPSPAEVRRHRTQVADASLHVYTRAVAEYLGRVPLSRTNEIEVAAALSAWIADGARIAAIPGETPVHVTDLPDFLAHNVVHGRRLVAAAEIERALTQEEEADEDISDYVFGLGPEDLPFVCRRLRRLAAQPMSPNRQARVLAVLSEILRHRAEALTAAPTPEIGALLAAHAPEDVVARLEPQSPLETPDGPTCYGLAVAYGRRANAVVAEAVLHDALARAQADTPTAFGERVVVRTPARLAFSSSQGSDISYIIEEKSAVILNCAITVNGRPPGTLTIERTQTPCVELVSEDFGASKVLSDWEGLLGPVDRQDPLILLHAGLRYCGLFPGEPAGSLSDWLEGRGGGVRVTVGCTVPKGSGLGCSGILAAGLVKGLRVFAGLETNDPELLVRAYCCERFYGRSGYQDIIGGSWGGVKLIQADGATGLFSPRIERLELPPERLAELRENVLVFYTGKPHLDRQYLLTIPAKYFTRAGDYMYAYENGKQLTRAMAEALSHGDWERLGRLIHEYWDDREYFEEGVTPEYAQRLRRDLAEWCFGTALCGSGHGGYMMAVLRSGARDRVLEYLAARQITQEQVLGFAVSPEGSVVEECK